MFRDELISLLSQAPAGTIPPRVVIRTPAGDLDVTDVTIGHSEALDVYVVITTAPLEV